METNITMMDTLMLRTASPFNELFPIRENILNDIIASMKKYGYESFHPIIVWAGHKVTVVDGHTRLAAVRKIGLSKVPVVLKEFADEDEALEYAIACQRGRRNLTDGEIMDCLEALDHRKKPGRQESSTSNEVKIGRSSQETADMLGTSATKIEKLRAINSHAEPEIQQALRDGKISVHKAYCETMTKRKQVESKKDPIYVSENTKASIMRNFLNAFEHLTQAMVVRAKNEHPEVKYTEKELDILIEKSQKRISDVLKGLPRQSTEVLQRVVDETKEENCFMPEQSKSRGDAHDVK